MPKKEQPSKEDYQSDIVDLQRKILKGVQLRDIKFLDTLTGQDRLEFLTYCSLVAENPWFHQLFPTLFFDQLLAASNSGNFDEVSFHRSTTNGIQLVKELFEKYSRQYTTEYGGGKPEDFDPSKPFSPVKNNN